MTAIDGWTLNKKIDAQTKELKEYIMYIGGKVLTLEEKLNKCNCSKVKDSPIEKREKAPERDA